MPASFRDQRAALVVAHPGHELRVYNWLCLVRPIVFVLTDGSGHSGRSRIHQSTNILASVGAQTGCIYGRVTDAEIYSAVLRGDFTFFIEIALELTEALSRDGTGYVVGDAIEGYNPIHDICRLIINAAVNVLGRIGARVENFDVLLAGRFTDCSPERMAGAISIELNDEMLSRKLQVVGDYPEVAVDVRRIIEEEGIVSLRTECLRRVTEESDDAQFKEPPFYETYGKQQVAAGHYRQVIRYSEHVQPIAQALREFVDSRSRAANCEF